MPQLKAEIASFSTEDPVHVANNILNSDTTKKWKCQTAGEKSASVILQLEKACTITGVDIGNENSAYVEILVNRSCTPDVYKVLLVMSSFMSPLESRQSTNINKVRMFGYNELQSPERDEKWDRIKITCSQPFNRSVQFGLSFVTIHSTERKQGNVDLSLGNFVLRPKSPDNLSIGSLFARRKELADSAPLTAAAAIRNASSSPSSSHNSPKPKLKDTIKTFNRHDANSSDSPRSRNRNELLYSKDDEEPNVKIDKLIDEKIRETKEKQLKEEEANKKNKHKKKETKQVADTSKRKLNGKDTPNKKQKVRREKPFNKLLQGVTIVISGIQNPERATIRSDALEMGAKYKTDWDDSCTHLICAFTNTPKFNQVKGKGKIVNRLWIPDCHSQRKRLPWRTHALDPKELAKDLSEDEVCELTRESPKMEVIFQHRLKSESDTEDEIEPIQELKRDRDQVMGDYAFDTDDELVETGLETMLPDLPDFFSNKVLYVDVELNENVRRILLRYIVAFNGILVDEASDVVDFAISADVSADYLRKQCPDAQVVSPDWIWECHNEKRLLPPDEFKL